VINKIIRLDSILVTRCCREEMSCGRAFSKPFEKIEKINHVAALRGRDGADMACRVDAILASRNAMSVSVGFSFGGQCDSESSLAGAI
jgi:hypothetical protein